MRGGGARREGTDARAERDPTSRAEAAVSASARGSVEVVCEGIVAGEGWVEWGGVGEERPGRSGRGLLKGQLCGCCDGPVGRAGRARRSTRLHAPPCKKTGASERGRAKIRWSWLMTAASSRLSVCVVCESPGGVSADQGKGEGLSS